MFQLSKTKIFIAIFIWLLLLGGTYFLSNHFIATKETPKSSVAQETYSVDYHSIIKENNLIIDMMSTTKSNTTYYYYKIDGLKDQRVEEKINKELKQQTFKYSYGGSILSNYSNVLSIDIDEYHSSPITLNYDLITGNKIEFNDLFNKGSNYWTYVASALYDEFAYRITDDLDDVNLAIACLLTPDSDDCYYDDYNYYLDEYDGNVKSTLKELKDEKSELDSLMANMEDSIFEIINYYKVNGINTFAFFSNKIIIYDKPNILQDYFDHMTIKGTDYYKDLAIFNRYVTKDSIFNSSKSHINTTYILDQPHSDYSSIKNIGNYGTLEYYASTNNNSKQFLDFLNNLTITKDEDMYTYRIININDEGYYEDSSINSFYSEEITCTMKKDYYQNIFLPLRSSNNIFDSSEDAIGYYIYSDTLFKNIDGKIKCDDKIYNTSIIDKKGNIYSSVDDIFKSNINIHDYLKYFVIEQIKEELSKEEHEYDQKEKCEYAQNNIDDFTYSLSENSIIVSYQYGNSIWDNYNFYIYYKDINSADLIAVLNDDN